MKSQQKVFVININIMNNKGKCLLSDPLSATIFSVKSSQVSLSAAVNDSHVMNKKIRKISFRNSLIGSKHNFNTVMYSTERVLLYVSTIIASLSVSDSLQCH